MSDDVKGFVVGLEKDLSEDMAEKITTSIRLIKGVYSVEKVPTEINDHLNRMQIRNEIAQKLWKVLWGKDDPATRMERE